MKQLISQVLGRDEFRPFQTPAQFSEFLHAGGLDGIEGVYYEREAVGRVEPGKLVGLHLPFYADWLPFWLGQTEHLDREFGGREVWQSFYQGADRTAFDRFFGEALEFAHQQRVEYVVFHVGQISLGETLDYRMLHTDRQVIDAAAELVNRILDPYGPARTSETYGQPYQFHFLMENLWWPGLNFKDVSMTKRLLSLVQYPGKGLILDTGHLLCANLALQTADEVMPYLWRVLAEHREVLPWIKGVHLHQSLSSAYTLAAIERAEDLSAVRTPRSDYLADFARSYAHVQQIDCHEPWSVTGLDAWLEELAPEYLVHEFRAADQADRLVKLKQQQSYL